MNTQEYISSGIVESYVLGLANAAERAEFERMCASHPEVLAARISFEEALENEAFAGAVPPPADLKNKVFFELNINQPKFPAAREQESRVVQMESHNAPRRSWAKLLSAAAVILLIGSTILNFYLFRQYQDYSERYSALLASHTELANNNRVLQTSLDSYRTTIARIKDPAVSVIRMAGTAVPQNGSPDPSSVATIYWDKRSSEVYLLVNNLPKNQQSQQYQLWAIVDGKPVSAGVFDATDTDAVFKMTNISGAQAFAVTLEKRGGVPAPEGKMYVLGAI